MLNMLNMNGWELYHGLLRNHSLEWDSSIDDFKCKLNGSTFPVDCRMDFKAYTMQIKLDEFNEPMFDQDWTMSAELFDKHARNILYGGVESLYDLEEYDFDYPMEESIDNIQTRMDRLYQRMNKKYNEIITINRDKLSIIPNIDIDNIIKKGHAYFNKYTDPKYEGVYDLIGLCAKYQFDEYIKDKHVLCQLYKTLTDENGQKSIRVINSFVYEYSITSGMLNIIMYLHEGLDTIILNESANIKLYVNFK